MKSMVRAILITSVTLFVISVLIAWYASLLLADNKYFSETMLKRAVIITNNNEKHTSASSKNFQKIQPFGLPLNDALVRVVKKPFAIKVSPAESPVLPERFYGYHTGVDFEILPGEENVPVGVSAICPGKILIKRRINGYGGILLQSCRLDEQEVTVLYGHLALSSIIHKVGDNLAIGVSIGDLGTGYSYDTDGERKHLHLSIHRGPTIDYRGYVQKLTDLNNWIDYLKIVK